MYEKQITYTDFNGNQQTETHYFHISRAEAVQLQFKKAGGFGEYLQQIINDNDGRAIMEAFSDILAMAWGEKSADGKRFVKDPERFREFHHSAAYDEYFAELVTSADEAAKFVTEALPNNLQELVGKQQETLTRTPAKRPYAVVNVQDDALEAREAELQRQWRELQEQRKNQPLG
jgi:hypothetical protein